MSLAPVLIMINNEKGIIIYPVDYSLQGDEDYHFVFGLREDSTPIKIRLLIDDLYKGNKGTPSILEFSRTDYKANNYCIAKETNGPKNREGVLVFSQVNFEFFDEDGIGNYVAKWASVISRHSESPDPVVGLGRIEINKESFKISEFKRTLQDMKRNNANQNDISHIEDQINNPIHFSYFSVFYYHEKAILIPFSNRTLGVVAGDIIDTLTSDGVIGGVLIRVFDEEDNPISPMCLEIFSRFSRSMGRYESGEDAIKRATLQEMTHWNAEGMSIEIIPIARFNAGASATRHYSKPENYSFISRTFYDDSGNHMLSRVVIRLDIIKDQGYTFVNRIHSLSEPLFNPFNIKTKNNRSKLNEELINEVINQNKIFYNNELIADDNHNLLMTHEKKGIDSKHNNPENKSDPLAIQPIKGKGLGLEESINVGGLINKKDTVIKKNYFNSDFCYVTKPEKKFIEINILRIMMNNILKDNLFNESNIDDKKTTGKVCFQDPGSFVLNIKYNENKALLPEDNTELNVVQSHFTLINTKEDEGLNDKNKIKTRIDTDYLLTYEKSEEKYTEDKEEIKPPKKIRSGMAAFIKKI